MKKQIIISIAKPCTENWSKMTPSEKGRFCGQCNKEVIDFTKMTSDQVIDCLANKSDQKICGLFRNEQLGKPKTKLNNFLINIYQKTTTYSKIGSARAAVLMILGFIISLTGCDENVKGAIAKPATQTPNKPMIDDAQKVENIECFKTKGEAAAVEIKPPQPIKKK
jgi:hypothetical protein